MGGWGGDPAARRHPGHCQTGAFPQASVPAGLGGLSSKPERERKGYSVWNSNANQLYSGIAWPGPEQDLGPRNPRHHRVQ